MTWNIMHAESLRDQLAGVQGRPNRRGARHLDDTWHAAVNELKAIVVVAYIMVIRSFLSPFAAAGLPLYHVLLRVLSKFQRNRRHVRGLSIGVVPHPG